jgi:hypothetical protein
MRKRTWIFWVGHYTSKKWGGRAMSWTSDLWKIDVLDNLNTFINPHAIGGVGV